MIESSDRLKLLKQNIQERIPTEYLLMTKDNVFQKAETFKNTSVEYKDQLVLKTYDVYE